MLIGFLFLFVHGAFWVRLVGKHTRHRREVADVAVHLAEAPDDRFLVGGDAVEIAHAALKLPRE
jgi:hypothetical protein